ncbi:hypothetical protein CONLIGDRAFT_371576 [Coniochaeta ligniaria NRRL 30616]|uniref:Uncharacterized protein n=1 Tax=Coniochaeta ligniaria NRRL 30616 TaxID=1408157 RepID=A0A1J7ILF3_9PEZI|nr:hypothetical protein CONLIGDRAFT_371576 [Coniochaeta ligniaria NRRL 30616]
MSISQSSTTLGAFHGLCQATVGQSEPTRSWTSSYTVQLYQLSCLPTTIPTVESALGLRQPLNTTLLKDAPPEEEFSGFHPFLTDLILYTTFAARAYLH